MPHPGRFLTVVTGLAARTEQPCVPRAAEVGTQAGHARVAALEDWDLLTGPRGAPRGGPKKRPPFK